MPTSTHSPQQETLSTLARSRAASTLPWAHEAPRGEPVGVLEYRTRRTCRRMHRAAQAIELSGGAIFFVGGVGLISTFLSDARFFQMPPDRVLRAFLLISLPLIFGGASCVCGGALRRGALWAGPACGALLAGADLLWLILSAVLVYRLIAGAPGETGLRLAGLAFFLFLAAFHGVLLGWIIRDDLYPRWQARRDM